MKKEIAEKQAEEAKIREEAERYRKAADAQMKNLSQMQEILQMRIHDLHEEKKALTTENEQLAGLINSRQQDVEVAKQERQAAQQSVVAATGDRDKERLRNEQATASYQQLLAEFKKYNISLPTSPLEVAPTPMENDPLAGFTLPGHSSTEVDEQGKGRTR